MVVIMVASTVSLQVLLGRSDVSGWGAFLKVNTLLFALYSSLLRLIVILILEYCSQT